jgi:hypothetical protein
MGDYFIDLTKSLNGGVTDAFLPPPPAAPLGRVVADPGVFWASGRYE